MALTMIDTILLGFIALWILAASIARAREKRSMLKAVEPVAKSNEQFFNTLAKDVAEMKKEFTKITGFLKEVLYEEEIVIPVEATRVYAVILQHGSAQRLHILPASTTEEFTQKSKAILGSGWIATVIEYLDVFPPKEIPIAPGKVEAVKKEMGLREGLYFLQLARDKFAKGKQKEAMEEVISNYMETYELS